MARGNNPTPALLDDTGLTLGDLHRASGVDLGYLSRIFAGKQGPSLATARRIAPALGWSLDELMTRLDSLQPARRGRAARRRGSPKN